MPRSLQCVTLLLCWNFSSVCWSSEAQKALCSDQRGFAEGLWLTFKTAPIIYSPSGSFGVQGYRIGYRTVFMSAALLKSHRCTRSEKAQGGDVSNRTVRPGRFALRSNDESICIPTRTRSKQTNTYTNTHTHTHTQLSAHTDTQTKTHARAHTHTLALDTQTKTPPRTY